MVRNPFSAKCMWCETAHQLYLYRSVRIGSRLRCSCSFRAGSSFTQLTSPWNLEACSPQLPLLKAAWHACPSCSLLQDGIGWSNKTTSANTPGFLPHHSDLQQPSPGALPHLTVQCREFSLKSPSVPSYFNPNLLNLPFCIDIGAQPASKHTYHCAKPSCLINTVWISRITNCAGASAASAVCCIKSCHTRSWARCHVSPPFTDELYYAVVTNLWYILHI